MNRLVISIKRPEVDSFYSFSTVSLSEEYCHGLACFVARDLNPSVYDMAVRQTPPTYCLGKCYLAPSWSGIDAPPIMESRSRTAVLIDWIKNGPIKSLDEYKARGGMKGLEVVLTTMGPEDVISEVEKSGLRGRGGAGFPTGLKWRSAYQQRVDVKYLVVNGDEGDPGAYIDRYLMSYAPYLVLEGALIAAYAIGAGKVYVYIRREYPDSVSAMARAVEELRSAGYLGNRVLGKDVSIDVEVVVGKGSYVAGEETALINAIMGNRAEPMPRPPYPTERGLFGKPTVVNNVETLANISWIMIHGGKAYYELGFSKSRGTKLISLNSLFKRPGIYEIEFGITLREIVFDIGGGLRDGRKLRGLVVGSFSVVRPEELDVKFGYEELRSAGVFIGHGSIVAFDDHTTPLELLHHMAEFGAYESCGKCFPCRYGNAKILDIAKEALGRGFLTKSEAEEVKSVAEVMRSTSLCGFGTGMGDTYLHILSKYPEVVGS